jgi:TPR repeat protein
MLEGDYGTAFNYLTKAAELGDVDAHVQLGGMYLHGDGVEKDEERQVYHYEKAAISGNPHARHDLGDYELRNGNIERAVKHYIIAANLGCEYTMKELWSQYTAGNISKKDLDATLRTHQAAVDATKSAERDAAEKYGF